MQGLIMEIVTVNHRPLKEEKPLFIKYKKRMGVSLKMSNFRDETALFHFFENAADTNTHVVFMDETGEDFTSVQVARKLKKLREEQQVRRVCFVIGPAEGCSKAVKEKANWMWRFGMVTWSHHLMQVMLAEQLYRISTIMRGHPYHRSANGRE